MAVTGITIENPLADLEKKIEAGQNVTEAEVNLAFDKEEQSVQKLYDQLKEPVDSLVRKDHFERLKAYRITVLKEARDLRTALNSGRLKLFAESRALRAALDPRVNAIQSKHQIFEQAIEGARVVTDPDSPTPIIDDYEGFNLNPMSSNNENSNNKTRWTLSGYIAGLQINDPALAGAEINHAKELYENSRFHGNYGDKCFNFEHLEKGMGLAAYLSDLRPYGFSDETNGLLAAYLKVADTFGANKDNYRAYFFTALDKLKAEGVFNFPQIQGESEVQKVINTAKFEIDKLENKIQWPREWLENIVALQNVFDRLKTDANSLTSSLGFKFMDPRVIDLLAKNKDQITPKDAAEITYVKGRVRDEGYVALLRTNSDVARAGAAVDVRFAEISAKNNKVKKYSAAEMAAVKAVLDDAKKDLGKVTLDLTASLDDLMEQNKFLSSARQKFGNAQERLNAMEIEMNKAPEPKPAPAPAPVTEKPAEKPAPKENKEDADFKAFLSEKNLLETKLGSGDAAKSVYEYRINPANIKAKVNDNGSPVFDYGNRDVNMILWRVNRMMDSVFGNLLDENDKKEIDKLASNESMSVTKRIATAAHYVIDKLGNRLDADGERKMKAIEKTFAKFGEIKITSDGKPTLAELKTAYESDFLEQWRSAAKDLIGLEKPAEKKGSVEIPKELAFLGPVYLQYVELLTALDKFGRNQEKYPEGINLPLALTNVPAWSRLQYTGEQGAPYKLFFEGGFLPFNSVEQVMRDLNSGTIHQKLTERILNTKDNYESWKDYIGDADKVEKMKGSNWTHLELDWNNPDADVFVEALPHGRIRFSVERENIGVRGENKYESFADNFNDLLFQLAHLRKWAEADEHKPEEDMASRKESLYRAITNPMVYRNLNAQKDIGRVLYMQTANNESARLYLDWGGGNNYADKNNARLDMFITNEGVLGFTVNGHGVGPEGRGVGPEFVYTFEQMMARVKALHDAAILERN